MNNIYFRLRDILEVGLIQFYWKLEVRRSFKLPTNVENIIAEPVKVFNNKL